RADHELCLYLGRCRRIPPVGEGGARPLSRRVNMPTADHLFRPTEPERARLEAVDEAPAARKAADEADDAPRATRSSGRVRHDEKMTVYVTADELLEIEHA